MTGIILNVKEHVVVPRRTAAEKAETHTKIVRTAARAFRAHGTAVGIADLMDDLGLTHGGFYRHFESKDDLVVEAVTAALDEVADRLVRAATNAPPGDERRAIITAYLSPEHLAHPETWCAIATLAGDLGRAPVTVRKRLDGALMNYAARIAPFMRGATDRERLGAVLVLLSGMAGAIAMIRAFGDRPTRDGALAAVREYYLRAFD